MYFFAEMTILLEKSAYTTNETVASVDLCVVVVMGHLGTTLSLQLDTYSGTAKGEHGSSTIY